MTNTNITSDLLETLCSWSAPRQIRTSYGEKLVRTATPGAKFWSVWRTGESTKQAMRDLGISVKPAEGEWIVNWYSAPVTNGAHAPADTRPADTSAATEAEVETAIVRTPNRPIMRWSAEQQAIFTWFESGNGALVVRARAGTGKTTTIKVAFTRAHEESMLYAVFNKKNQIEAQNAILDPRVEIKTLHALGFMFIQQVWPGSKPTDEVENDRVTQIVGEQSPREVKTQVKKLVGFAKNTFACVPTLENMLDLAEERDIECPQFESEKSGGFTRRVLSVLALKVMDLSTQRDPQGRVSFNDMVWLPVTLGWTRAWYDLVVVDEAQDMNLPQLLMAKAAVKTGGRICVVGDDRQAIYHFRGAASDGMDMMKTSLNACELGLTITYRCPKQVVQLAAALVPDYRAADTAPEGVVEGMDVNTITAQIKVGDAILSRANAPLMSLCLSLLRKGTPARIEGRDVGKALADIAVKLNARSVPQFMHKVEVWRDQQITRFQTSKNFEEKSAQINDQADTLVAVAEGASSVTEVENRLASLFQDTNRDSKPAVVLSTTHKAKGLEWPKVYLMRDTFMARRPASAPPLSAAAAAARAKEEANIYYVALTRAKAHLVLAHGRLE